jgi:tetratricopeptide (TPR) repeat protein
MKRNNPILILAILFLFGFQSCTEESSNDGDKYFAQGQYEEAIQAYDRFLSNNPKNVKALYNRGRAHEELGNFESAEKDFLAALEQDNTNVQVMLSLSNVYQKQKNHSSALLYAEYAVERPGAPAMAYFLKARALHQLGNVEEAMREYTAAIKMDPESGQALYYRGILNYATDKKRAACADFEAARRQNYELAQEAIDKYCK